MRSVTFKSFGLDVWGVQACGRAPDTEYKVVGGLDAASLGSCKLVLSWTSGLTSREFVSI